MENEEVNEENEVPGPPSERPRKKVRLKKSNKVWYKRKRVRKGVEKALWIILLAAFFTSLFLIWPKLIRSSKSPAGRIRVE